jgi:hypothetical protein
LGGSSTEGTHLLACACSGLADLQWALATFSATRIDSQRMRGAIINATNAPRAECWQLLVQTCKLDAMKILQACCELGHLDLAP